MSNVTDQATEIVIREIVAEFNFQKVQQIMIQLNWEWYFDGVMRVPTLDEMKEAARRLLLSAARTGSAAVQSGGFMAQRVGSGLALLFAVETADCQYPDAEEMAY